ncbi:MAG: hypothetical protein K8U03_07035 [Planctomycetia bacterium]|nr:hypothetical protein [Planctomycetia bacterium]
MHTQAFVTFDEILSDLVLADAIYYRFGDQERLLWARPAEEIVARDDSFDLMLFTYQCQNIIELQAFKAMVSRLKCSDRFEWSGCMSSGSALSSIPSRQ